MDATSTSIATTTTAKAPTAASDPYKEFELYLEKAHEEIGAVFHQLEARCRIPAGIVSPGVSSASSPPPVPVRRSRVPPPSSSRANGGRGGLRVTEDYFIGDLEPPPPHHHHQRYWTDPQHVGLLRRRISCPGLANNNRSQQQQQHVLNNQNIINNIINNNNNNHHHPLQHSPRSRVALMTDLEPSSSSTSNAAGTQSARSNPRRQLRRYLTADSAVLQHLHQLSSTDNKKKSIHPLGGLDDPSGPTSSAERQQHSINLWTSGLMEEFNHVIDGELQRLTATGPPEAGRRQEPEGAEEAAASAQPGRSGQRRLSPWARMQMAIIDPLPAQSLPAADRRASIEQLSADIDTVQRQILHDLDDLTATLERQEKQLAATSSKTSASINIPPEGKEDEEEGTIVVEAPDNSCSHRSVDHNNLSGSGPILRPQELQDFLRRVEDSITGSLDRHQGRKPSNSAIESEAPAAAPPVEEDQEEEEDVDEEEEDDGLLDRRHLPAEAATQTSPMSLSRSSSFLWVSDCNCSGSLDDGSAPLAPGVPALSSSCPPDPSVSSEAGSSSGGVSRIVHMDTSTASSMVSLESGRQRGHHHHHRRNRGRMCTPDSAAEAEDDEDEDDDDDGGSSVSLARSLDGGLGGGGAESGIGTGSPRPPRERRRRPLPPPQQSSTGPETTTMMVAVGVQCGSDPMMIVKAPSEEDLEQDSSCSSSCSTPSTSSSSGACEVGSGKKKMMTKANRTKNRDKVRRRETWEKLRRRHSSGKRTQPQPPRRNNSIKTSAEMVWIPRRDAAASPALSASPIPPPVPPHAVPIPSSSSMEPIRHKPPVVVVVPSSSPVIGGGSRPKPRPLPLTEPPPGSAFSSESSVVASALHSALSMELTSAQSAPFLQVSHHPKRHHPLSKPISASSTPTEPYITMEASLTAARSHSESAFAELEATEACRWLRATGFPQYAQMYEDWQFPLDLNVVERDHPFLDMDSLQALFRRLSTLNRMARMRSEKASRRRVVHHHPGDVAASSGAAAAAAESDDEDQECALSDQWTFQRHSRRWSRIVDLLPPGDQLQQQGQTESGSGTPVHSAHGGGSREQIPFDEQQQLKQLRQDEASGERTPATDPVILGSFRRSSSERLRHGAKNLLRRMESLRSRSGRRRPPTRPEGSPATGGLVIGSPQVVDPAAMEDRMRDRNWVDLSPTGSAPSPDGSSAQLFLLQQQQQQQHHISHETPSGTPSPAGSLKTPGGKSSSSSGDGMSRSFFGRRSFRPSTSTSSAASTDDPKDATGAHSDSECSPSYSPRRRRDANSNETDKPLAVTATSTEPSSSRGRLYLNFNAKTSLSGRTKKSSSATSVLPSPDDDSAGGQKQLLSGATGSTDTTPTPSGSLREGERLLDALLSGLAPEASTPTGGAEGSVASIPSAPSAASPRGPIVVRWHSFRRSSSTSSSINSVGATAGSPSHQQQLQQQQQQPSPPASNTPDVATLSVDQLARLRKLALLRLTALVESHTSSSKPSWGWDLPKFMRKTKSPDYKDKNIFGVPLSVIVQRTGEALPRPILAALHYLRQSALDQVGLFRKSGVRSRIAKIKEACEAWTTVPSALSLNPAAAAAVAAGCYPSDSDRCQQDLGVDFDQHQPYDVADMVKQYFRELPEALMTNKLSETFVTIFQVVPVGLRLDALRCAILLLPDEHREALQTFLAFLTDVAALASVNQMTPSNLAVCLAPSLFHLPATSSISSTSSSSSAPSPSVMSPGSPANSVPGTASHRSGGTTPTSSSPRRRKTVGVPDQRELSQNKAAHDCLLQMILDFRSLFTVPEDLYRQFRCTYTDEDVPVTLEDLRTPEFGDWQAYMNGCMAAMLKETKDKSRGWESVSNEFRLDVAWKKVGDGHVLRLWRVSAEIEAPPAELLHKVLRERHLWDTSVVRQRTLVKLGKQSEVFYYSTASEVPPSGRDYVLLRSWRNDLPRGMCLVAETSIEHAEAPLPGATTHRGVVLASRYLIQPCGAGKSRLVHLSRVDAMGRSPEWYNKNYGHICALHVARLRDSFRQHLVIAQGLSESKV